MKFTEWKPPKTTSMINIATVTNRGVYKSAESIFRCSADLHYEERHFVNGVSVCTNQMWLRTHPSVMVEGEVLGIDK